MVGGTTPLPRVEGCLQIAQLLAGQQAVEIGLVATVFLCCHAGKLGSFSRIQGLLGCTAGL
jgi:hypothetical protein